MPGAKGHAELSFLGIEVIPKTLSCFLSGQCLQKRMLNKDVLKTRIVCLEKRWFTGLQQNSL